MQVPILNGITSDSAADFRTRYPRNMVPVPKAQGVSKGYLRPADGMVQTGTGPGVGRGGINWNGVLYRVLGSKLCTVAPDGSVTELGDVGPGGQCTLDYSFDRLGIVSGGRLYFWDGSALVRVTDPDLGTVLDTRWVSGYWVCTDGNVAVVTDLVDPTSVNPLRYGSAESDPDPIKAVDQLHNEVYLFGRHTIQVSQNVGGDGYPFQDIPGAQINKGIVGTYAYSDYQSTYAFVGSGRNEAVAVYMVVPGDTQKLSTREIDQVLKGYTEAELAAIVVESRLYDGHEHLFIHLPDQCLVYDHEASKVVQEPVWFSLDSSATDTPSTYRARNLVWCYGQWNCEDPTSAAVGYLSNDVGSHWGADVAWEFGTVVAYAEGNDAIVHELELVTLPGRAALGADPTVWTSHSFDGQTWSMERPKKAGKQGERTKRLAWRGCGRIRHTRMQRFRGLTDCRASFVRLEIQIEPLFTRPGAGNG